MQAKKCKITLDYRRSQTMPQKYSNDSSIVYTLIFQIKKLCIVEGPNHSSRKCQGSTLLTVTPDHIRFCSLQAQEVYFHSVFHHISTIIRNASGQLQTHKSFSTKIIVLSISLLGEKVNLWHIVFWSICSPTCKFYEKRLATQ